MTTITKDEQAALRRIAEGATIGKPNGSASFITDSMVAYQFEAKDIHAGDFQFFLHFSPANVLRLLDAQEAAESHAAEMKRQRDKLINRLVYLEDYPPGWGVVTEESWLVWAAQKDGEK